MKRRLLLLLVIAVSSVSAQNYKVSLVEPVGGYKPLPETTTQLIMPWGHAVDTANPYTYINVPGFTIKIFGTKYTFSEKAQLGISILGNLKIEDDTSVIIIDGYFTTIDSTGPSAKVLYQVSGDSGNRVISIEWRKIGYWSCNDSSHVTFKMNLEEKTGYLVFDYGENVIVCDSVFGDEKGPYVGLFRSNKTFDKFYKICWLSGNPLSPKITASSLPALGGIPPVGKSYIFTPPLSDVSEDVVHSVLPRITYGVDGITLHTQPLGEREATIYDVLGRVVGRFTISNDAIRTVIPTPQLSQGAYFIKIDGELRRVIL